ncbi:MAG: peptidylprolyl isomerase [Clostridia bacterium]|nr:peptidylprolyl isomerase [Clostridia bacterium]
MKKTGLICVILAALFVFASCSSGGGGTSDASGASVPALSGDYVLKYGDNVIDEYDYMYLASLAKDQIVYNQQYYIYQTTGQVLDEQTILALQVSDDGKTVADSIKESILEMAQQMIIIEKLCEDAGIKITDQESLDKIKAQMDDLEYAYGGADLFDVALVRMGFTRDAIERYNRFVYLYELYREYRYGENGVAPIAESVVKNYYAENYYRYQGAVFPFVDSEGKTIEYNVSDDGIEDYFAENYVKISHILYKTSDVSVNSSGGITVTPYDDEKIAEVEKKANEALEAVKSGEKQHADLKGENEDENYTYVFTRGEMVEEFETAAFEMEPGDVRLVKTEYGYHLMYKEELSEEDLYGTEDPDGTVKNSIVDEVKAAISKENIKALANGIIEDLNSGKATSFPESIEGFAAYEYDEPAVINKNDTTYQTLIELIESIEEGKCGSKEFADVVYVIGRLPAGADTITESVYGQIESDLAANTYLEYVSSFYNDVEVNKASIEKFNINTLPALEDEFYQ